MMDRLDVGMLKKWQKIDYPDDDLILANNIALSKAFIFKATGCTYEIAKKNGEEASDIYTTTQIRICKNMYEDAEVVEDSFVVGMYMTLQSYALREK